MSLNSLRNDKTLDWSKLNAPADDKITVLKMMMPDFDRVENIVGKGENAGFLQCFQRALFLHCLKGTLPRIIKSRECVEKKVDSLHNDKIQDWSKLKAPADNKINANEKSKFVSQRVENCTKRRKCWLSAFSPFPTMFSKGLSVRVVESRHCVVMSQSEFGVEKPLVPAANDSSSDKIKLLQSLNSSFYLASRRRIMFK